jgi:hypothetical protein
VTLQLGILLALICALTTNLGFFYKHRGACAAEPVDIKHPLHSAKSLWSSKWFAIGMLVAISAWGFHVAALALAPMSVVQAVLAGGVVMLAVMPSASSASRWGAASGWVSASPPSGSCSSVSRCPPPTARIPASRAPR